MIVEMDHYYSLKVILIIETFYFHLISLLFFYIMNYFIFPKENIFKSLSLENVDYKKSYEEGALKGNHLSFIVLNLFDEDTSPSSFTTAYLTDVPPTSNAKYFFISLSFRFLHYYSIFF